MPVSFMCQMCGQVRYNRVGNSLSSYDKECWNLYMKQRYLHLKRGEPFTIKLYREWRRRNGMQIPEVEPKQGRNPGNLPSEVALRICPTCNEHVTTKPTEYGVCPKCYANAREWYILDRRITPEVFFTVQSSFLNDKSAPAGGYLAVPAFKMARQITPQIERLLEAFTPEVRRAQIEWMRKEFGWTGQ